ncbi:MAG: DUF305 domain-containing protein [Desulfuromonadales bacterium]
MLRWFFLSVGLAGLIAGTALAQDPHLGWHGEGRPEDHGTTSAGFAAEMDAGMAKMMRDMHAPGYTGNPDIDFLAMMIPHHEGAVEMARLVLVHGRDPLTRKLAGEIIASQIVEIEGMKRRLAILQANPRPRPGEFPALDGTRGPDQEP